MVNEKAFIAARGRIHAKQLKVFGNSVLAQVQYIQVLQVFKVWWKWGNNSLGQQRIN